MESAAESIGTPAGRALGLDFGNRRIGVAISDAGQVVATPYQTIGRVGDRNIEHGLIGEIVAEESVTLIVVGLPLSLRGEEGEAVRAVRSEVKALRKRFGIQVELCDERFTTVTAEQRLTEMGVKGQKRKEMVDQIAASIILQTFLDRGADS